MKLVTIEQMRLIEQQASEQGLTQEEMMQKAANAVSRLAMDLLQNTKNPIIVVLIGPGNNGVDGLISAAALTQMGCQVTAYICKSSSRLAPKLSFAENQGVLIIHGSSDPTFSKLNQCLKDVSLIIDAILGIGHTREIQEPLSRILELVRSSQLKQTPPIVLSVDLPTGVDGNSGYADHHHIYANATISLGYPKVGLFSYPGAEFTGELFNAPIGIPENIAADISNEIITADSTSSRIGGRSKFSHKGTFGKSLVIAGSTQYIGAAYLACMGAIRSGCGYVTLASLSTIYPILSTKLVEATHLVIPESVPGTPAKIASTIILEAAKEYDSLLIGCGLGKLPGIAELVSNLLLQPEPALASVVIDADALSHLSQIPQWWKKLTGPTVITPHPGEMAVLTGKSIIEIQNNRAEFARQSAEEWGVTVVLKGAYTLVSSPDGRQALSPFANPILATAGTGDALAGVITGLLAQGLNPFDAATSGVYIHGTAGDILSKNIGDRGAIASELVSEIPNAIKAIRNKNSPSLTEVFRID